MIAIVTGRHRGRAALRWRLVVAVLASAVGGGYAGRHRLEAAALGVRTVVSAPAVVQPPKPTSGARLAVVPVASSPDPLVDTVPHPVVKLFPMPATGSPESGSAERSPAAMAAEDVVFAEVDREREARATADLARTVDVRDATVAYRGRHSA